MEITKEVNAGGVLLKHLNKTQVKARLARVSAFNGDISGLFCSTTKLLPGKKLGRKKSDFPHKKTNECINRRKGPYVYNTVFCSSGSGPSIFKS